MGVVADELDPSNSSPITIGRTNATSVTITPNTTITGTTTHTGAATFSGAATVAGTFTANGASAFTGAVTGIRSAFTNSALVGATVALTAAQSGGTFNNRSTSGTPKWTLPAAAAGLEFTFTVSSITAGIIINAADAATIRCKTSATGTTLVSTATTGTVVNTQATAVIGDAITVVCDGTNWQLVSQTGIFSVT